MQKEMVREWIDANELCDHPAIFCKETVEPHWAMTQECFVQRWRLSYSATIAREWIDENLGVAINDGWA